MHKQHNNNNDIHPTRFNQASLVSHLLRVVLLLACCVELLLLLRWIVFVNLVLVVLCCVVLCCVVLCCVACCVVLCCVVCVQDVLVSNFRTRSRGRTIESRF